MADEASAERIARNDDIFRKANERIRVDAEASAVVEGIPFLCECPDRGCLEVIRLTLDEYAAVREDAREFVVAPGHETGDLGSVEVVERHAGYDVIRKLGRAGEIAEELAPEGADASG